MRSPGRTTAVLLCLIAACAVGPEFHRPVAPADNGYGEGATRDTAAGDGTSQHFALGGAVAGSYWEAFECPALNVIVRDAILGNPGLESARATLLRNQHNLRAGYGVFLPQIDVKAGASRQLYNAAPGVLPSSTYNLYSVSGTVSYSLDLWGGERRQVEALGAAVAAQKYTLAGAYVMLTGNVINAVIAGAAYRAEIEATKATLARLKDQVRYAKAQTEAGTAPYSNVLSLESQLATIEATLPPLESKADQATDLLAALSGTTPSVWRQPAIALADLHLPAELPLSLPAELVRNRPDVLVAEEQLHAANANIGVATAAMLPNLSLSASYGANGTQIGAESPLWGIAAGLTQPIFHGGALYYQKKAAVDARDAAAADYRQTVLAAFQQVADTLRGLSHDAEAVRAEAEAVNSAERALELLQANYKAGIVTYLQVLVADIQYQQAKIGYVQAVGQRLQDTVALYVALGGGWGKAPASVWDSHDAGG